MSHLEMTQEALKELGDAPPQQLAEFIRQKFGAKVEPRAVLILKASVVAESLREAFLRKLKAEGGQKKEVSPRAD